MYGEAVWAVPHAGHGQPLVPPRLVHVPARRASSTHWAPARSACSARTSWQARHYVTRCSAGWASSTWAGWAACWADPRTGLLAMAMLVLSPRYFADSMNNPKDVAFAALSTRPSTTRCACGRSSLPRPAPVRPARDLDRAGVSNLRAGACCSSATWGSRSLGLTIARRAWAPRQPGRDRRTPAWPVAGRRCSPARFWPWAGSSRWCARAGRRRCSRVRLGPARCCSRDATCPRRTLPLDYVPALGRGHPAAGRAGGRAAVARAARGRRARARWLVGGLWVAALFPRLRDRPRVP